MLVINIQNVEEVVFLDKKLQEKLPEFRHLFDQWRLSKMSPALRHLGKRSLIDFLNKIKKDHINILEKHLQTTINVDKLYTNIVRNDFFDIFSSEEELNNADWTDAYPNFSTYVSGDKLYVSFWR